MVPARERWAEIHFLDRLLALVQAEVRRRAAARAGMWAAAAALAALAVLLAADAAIDFGSDARAAVYFIAALAAAAIISGAAWTAWMRRPSPLYLARLVEGRRPELKNALLTYVELRCAADPDPSACAAVGRRAARILSEADPAEFVPPGSLRPAALAAAASACALGATLWLGQGVLFHHWTAAAQASPGDRAGAAALSDRTGDPGTRGTAGLSGRGVGVTPSHRCESMASARQAGRPTSHGAGAAPGNALTAEAAGELAAAMLADREKLLRLADALAPQDPPADAPAPQNQAAPQPAFPSAPGGAGEPAARQDPGGATDKTHDPAGAASAAGASGAGVTGTRGTAGLSGRGGSAAAFSTAGQAGRASSDAGQGDGGGSARPPAADAHEGGPRSPAAPTAGSSAPPLPPLPQNAAFSEKILDAMRQVRQLIEAADERIRAGEAGDEFLGRIGMSNAEFRRFVAAWQRKLEAAAPEDPLPAPPARQPGEPPKKGEVIPGGAGADARPIVEAAPEAGTEAAAGDAGRVSARLRPSVAAYFEAVGRAAAKADAREAPK